SHRLYNDSDGPTIILFTAFNPLLPWLILGTLRAVADCASPPCQVTKRLERAKALEFTTITAIIFTHCCATYLFFILYFMEKINQFI
uniref:hypothetical protein n=1 Tax=Flavobacterium sp. TaxID=239 RepID=UPI004049C255